MNKTINLDQIKKLLSSNYWSDKQKANEVQLALSSIVAIEDIEQELNKTNSHNKNDCINSVKYWQNMKKELPHNVKEAKDTIARIKHQMDGISSLISSIFSIIQQEKIFDKVCYLYNTISENKFTAIPKSNVYFKDDNNELISYAIEELDNTQQFLEDEYHHKDEEIKCIEKIIASIDDKIIVATLNEFKFYKYGVSKKWIEKDEPFENEAEEIQKSIQNK